MALTDARIKTSKPKEKPYRLSDGRGLCLEVRPTGIRYWRYSYRLGGKQSMLTLGEYPRIPLAEARRLLEIAREQVSRGIDPNRTKALARLENITNQQNTFSVLAEEWYALNLPHWRPYTATQVRSDIDKDMLPHLGPLAVRDITPHIILALIRKIEERGANTVARNVRQRISAILRHAVLTQRADYNAAEPLRGALRARPVKHIPNLAQKDIGAFKKALNDYQGYGNTKQAIWLLLYTMCRTIEVRSMEWVELNLARAEWNIPGHKMKNGQPHHIPLPHQAVTILRTIQQEALYSRYVFPNTRDRERPISITTVNRILEKMGYAGKLSGHSFRGTASTILHEQGYRSEVIEKQLAHSDRNKVRAAYNHAQYREERKAMLQHWADFLDAQ